MKTITLIISTLVATVMIAQPKYTSVYSTHNYKMPANAKLAKEKNLDKNQSFEHKAEVKAGTESNSNYKNSFAKANTFGGQMPILPIEIVVNPMASKSNYKSNFKGATKKTVIQEVPVEQPQIISMSTQDSTKKQ